MPHSHINALTHEESARQFCTFRIAGRLFGVDLLKVKEVTWETEFTHVHHAPETIRGYVNIRGQVHLVGDLGTILGFEKKSLTQDHRVILFKSAVGDSFGVLVDSIGDVVQVLADEIESMREESGTQGDTDLETLNELVSGVCKLEENLLMLLDPEKIFGRIVV